MRVLGDESLKEWTYQGLREMYGLRKGRDGRVFRPTGLGLVLVLQYLIKLVWSIQISFSTNTMLFSGSSMISPVRKIYLQTKIIENCKTLTAG